MKNHMSVCFLLCTLDAQFVFYYGWAVLIIIFINTFVMTK